MCALCAPRSLGTQTEIAGHCGVVWTQSLLSDLWGGGKGLDGEWHQQQASEWLQWRTPIPAPPQPSPLSCPFTQRCWNRLAKTAWTSLYDIFSPIDANQSWQGEATGQQCQDSLSFLCTDVVLCSYSWVYCSHFYQLTLIKPFSSFCRIAFLSDQYFLLSSVCCGQRWSSPSKWELTEDRDQEDLPQQHLAQLEMQGQKLAASTMIYCELDSEGDPQNLTLASYVRVCFKRIRLGGKTSYL